MNVTLTWFEMYTAGQAGLMRRIEALKRGRPDRYGTVYEEWAADINGALAECALAKAQGRYWQSVATTPHALAGDVDTQQVRSTNRADGCLILHPEDPDDATFWLVLTHARPTFTIAGHIKAKDGKQPKWWRDLERPAYFVPQSALHKEPTQAAA